jgi:hypothetical protein
VATQAITSLQRDRHNLEVQLKAATGKAANERLQQTLNSVQVRGGGWFDGEEMRWQCGGRHTLCGAEASYARIEGGVHRLGEQSLGRFDTADTHTRTPPLLRFWPRRSWLM